MVGALERKEQVHNVLLFGPRGTGKTMLCCAARLGNWTVFELTQDVVMGCYPGESQK